MTYEVAVVPYDPAWRRRFAAERTLLRKVLKPWLHGGIHHVGSTAIPGVASKPIIDMLAGVRDLEEARAAFGVLAEHSYVFARHRPEIAHHFSKPSLDVREVTHGLHLTEPGSDLWRERLGFRDALRADAALAAEYERLKLRLAEQHRSDVSAYTAAKRTFVAGVLAEAGIDISGR